MGRSWAGSLARQHSGVLHRLCLQYMASYRLRLSELVLRGMASQVLSCRVSSTAVCVEVSPGGVWVAGGCRGRARDGWPLGWAPSG